MDAPQEKSGNLEFDQDTIRSFIGWIAFFLPFAVYIFVGKIPDSISASYHLPSGFSLFPYFPTPRDIFVGSLFVIGAFLMCYQGKAHEKVGKFWYWLAGFIPAAMKWGDTWRRRQEDIISTIAGLSAWIVALFPTEILTAKTICQQSISGLVLEEPDIYDKVSSIHFSFAAVLFLTTVYFCLVAFRVRLGGKIQRRGPAGPWYRDPLKRRLILYYVSGIGILLVILFVASFAVINSLRAEGNVVCLVYNQTYWAEVVMLFLFGVAWITASKPRGLRDPSDNKN